MPISSLSNIQLRGDLDFYSSFWEKGKSRVNNFVKCFHLCWSVTWELLVTQFVINPLVDKRLVYLTNLRSCIDLDSGWMLMDQGQSMSDCHVICQLDKEWPRTFIASLDYYSNLALREFAPEDSKQNLRQRTFTRLI